MAHQSQRLRQPRPLRGILGAAVALLIWLVNLLRFWIYTAIFFVLMVAVSYAIVSWYIKGEELAAPDLSGLTVIQALEKLSQTDLRGARLSVILERTQPHESYEKGLIISQDPEPRRRIKAGSPIRVVVSEGPPLATVPDVRGQSRIRAGILLRRNNLTIGNEAQMAVAGKAGGLVLSTDPPAATGVPEGTKVNLLLTAGEEQTSQMPNLNGLTLEEVREELNQLGLSKPDEIAAEGGETALPGQVHNQFPPAGEAVTPQTRLRVFYQPERTPTADEMPSDPPEDAADEPGAEDGEGTNPGTGLPSIDTSILPAVVVDGEAEGGAHADAETRAKPDVGEPALPGMAPGATTADDAAAAGNTAGGEQETDSVDPARAQDEATTADETGMDEPSRPTEEQLPSVDLDLAD